ncbi:MAG: restriction endonuclease [Nocardioidaceae bacterium]|nr:restriction endonuclease [Nocardioidaceae bacterium]
MNLVGMPVTEGQVRVLKPFEFQNWVVQAMHGTHAPRKSGDMGIDGYSFMLHEPIQVKQSDAIGRNVIDNFETAVERAGKRKGYIVAFSFGRGAHEEVARVRAAKGLDIVLVRVADLLSESVDLPTPEVGLLMPEAPLPEAPSADARPTVDELIASEHNAHELARAAEEPEPYGSE